MSCARFIIVIALALTSGAPSAQFVKGNDAVRVLPNGGDWLQCQYPDLHSRCIRLSARAPANLPFDAEQ